MAVYRNPNETAMETQPVAPAPSTYNVGNIPPLVNWTCVIGDSASFRIYVEDDLENAIDVDEWTIRAQFRRYSDDIGDDLVFITYPAETEFDDPGEFTVKVTAAQSRSLQTGDVFDVQLSDATRVWTVCQGEMIMIGDVTDQNS